MSGAYNLRNRALSPDMMNIREDDDGAMQTPLGLSPSGNQFSTYSLHKGMVSPRNESMMERNGNGGSSMIQKHPTLVLP